MNESHALSKWVAIFSDAGLLNFRCVGGADSKSRKPQVVKNIEPVGGFYMFYFQFSTIDIFKMGSELITKDFLKLPGFREISEIFGQDVHLHLSQVATVVLAGWLREARGRSRELWGFAVHAFEIREYD